MKNSFQVTEKSNEIILKILKTGLMVSVILLVVVFLKDLSNGSLSFVVGIGVLCLVPLLMLKGYKVVGMITFEENAIKTEVNGHTILFTFPEIRRVILTIRGRKRRSYLPSLLQPIGINRPDGTGNWIVIETEYHNYDYDLFLQNDSDSTSLDFQIKRLTDIGIKIEKLKLPSILGDSI